MGKNMSNKLHLRKQLYELKMEEGCDVFEIMNTFNRMINDLSVESRCKVRRSRQVLAVVEFSLTHDRFFTTCSMERRLNFEEVMQDITSNAARKKPSKGDSHSKGLPAKEGPFNHGKSKERGRSRRNNSRSKSRRKKDFECFHCGKKRHWKKDYQCYKATNDGRNKAGDKVESSDSASVALEIDVELLSVS